MSENIVFIFDLCLYIFREGEREREFIREDIQLVFNKYFLIYICVQNQEWQNCDSSSRMRFSFLPSNYFILSQIEEFLQDNAVCNLVVYKIIQKFLKICDIIYARIYILL